jgi:NADPH:quinone reductase-like Zn-dependent oxidoreductase
MNKAIPDTMKAIVLKENGSVPELIELPIPTPDTGEVLVKMHSSPINPSDLAFLSGDYGIKKELPVVPGLEGSGNVVEAGKGFLPKLWKGKNVA